jgi:hypothetical protein
LGHAGFHEEILDVFQQLSVGHDAHNANKYHKFPTVQPSMLGINEIAGFSRVWDIPNMATTPEKKERAQASALAIAKKLANFPPGPSERQWTIDAGVNNSWFSNLRGTPTKPPSDPSIDSLRAILDARGVTLAEFFLDEAQGRVARIPNRQALERAILDALPQLPGKSLARAQYLVQVVAGVLALPPDREAIPAAQDSEDMADLEATAPRRAATKRK